MMNWKPGTWIEPRQMRGPYGARQGTNAIIYILGYNDWGDKDNPDSYNIVKLRLDSGLYAGGSMLNLRLVEEDWEVVEMPPGADRRVIVAVFT